MSKYSGIRKVEIEASTGAWGGSQLDLGAPLADSGGLNQEVQEVEASNGNILYAGNKDMSEFNIPAFTHFAALKAGMEADTLYDVRITFMDNTTEVIHTNANITVRKNYGQAVGGRNSFTLKVQNYRTT